MSAGYIGSLIGSALFVVFAVFIWLIIAKVIPALRRRPAVSNGVGGALALFLSYAGVRGSDDYLPGILSAVVVLLLLWWNYRRDVNALAKKAAVADAPPT
jgi:hypothetical protein